ncbi:MAG: hypothetical protein K6B41_11230 [Butyrivibrio sp.]|nr:hypothetical protein [Butyrivibrio sp.]
MRKANKIALYFLIVMFLFIGGPLVTKAQSRGLGVTERSQDQIKAYINAKNVYLDDTISYDEQPSVTAPFKYGKISNTNLEHGLWTLNAVRYIAGLDEVRLDQNYNNLAQGAALIQCAINMTSHEPSKPAGMDEEMYRVCYEGSSNSNLGGCSSISDLILGLMSDQGNIDTMGHRRGCLNPKMGKTGFGYVQSSGAQYASDSSNYSASQTYVAWPARNTPVEFIEEDFLVWSISTGTTVSRSYSVELTRKNDGKTFKFSDSYNMNGPSYINNTEYGLSGAIIFYPIGITTYNPGDSYHVKITGATSQDIEYDVDFFSLNGSVSYSELSIENCNIDENGGDSFQYTGNPITPNYFVYHKGTSSEVRKMKEGKDYTLTYVDNVYPGKAKAVFTGLGRYKGTVTREFDIWGYLTDNNFRLEKTEIEFGENNNTVGVIGTLGDMTLVEGVHYNVIYSLNTRPGTANVRIIHLDDHYYFDMIVKQYTIKKKADDEQDENKTDDASDYERDVKADIRIKNGKVKIEGVTYTIKGRKATVKSVDKKVTYVSIPETLKIQGKKYKVTNIGSKAFYNKSKLKDIVVSDKFLKSFGKNAFGKLKKTTRVHIYYKDAKKVQKFADKIKKAGFKKTKNFRYYGKDWFDGVI